MFKFKSILAIGAHSDDIELSCFGFLLKQSKLGAKINVFVAAPSSLDQDLLSKRSQESKESFSLIQNSELFFSKEKQISEQNYISLSDQIREIIIEKEVDLILIHSKDDTHQEHRLCSNICVTSARRLPVGIFEFFSPSSTNNFNENLIVDITNEYQTKVKAIKKHKTQLDKIFMSGEYLESVNQIPEAKLLGINYSEKFKIVRMVEK